MNVNFEKNGNVNGVITITLGEADYAEKVKKNLKRIGQSEKKVVAEFEVGDRVKILSGPFANVEGIVESMDDASGVATVLAIMFGRETPTEVEYINLEKAI